MFISVIFNVFTSKNVIIIIKAIPTFFFCFSYVLFIIKYLTYSLVKITDPVTQKLIIKPFKVVEFGFLPNDTNNPEIKYTIIYPNTAIKV